MSEIPIVAELRSQIDRLTRELAEAARDWQAARDAHDRRAAENERLQRDNDAAQVLIKEMMRDVQERDERIAELEKRRDKACDRLRFGPLNGPAYEAIALLRGRSIDDAMLWVQTHDNG